MKHLSNLIILGSMAFLVLILIYLGLVAGLPFAPGRNLIIYSTIVVLFILLALSFRLGAGSRANLALTIASIGMTLYAIELVATLIYRSVEEKAHLARVEKANQAGQTFDERQPLAVIQQMERQGIQVYPYIHGEARASDGFRFEAGGRQVLALAGISGSQTVVCNETGEYMIFKSDRHGFNNPRDYYEEADVQIVVVGDSFAQGLCMGPGDDAVTALRETFPKTLNLGYAGNNSLLNLATLKEYVPILPTPPTRILWLFYEDNDLVRIDNQILSRYLEREFRQDLAPLQAEIDAALARRVAATRASLEQAGPLEAVIAFALFRNTRDWLGLNAILHDFKADESKVTFDEGLAEFEIVMAETAALSDAWGSDLYFVYLPGFRSVSRQSPYEHRQQVLEIVAELEIPIVDLYETFIEHPDPESLFPFRMLNHYNREGYRLVAATVLKALN